MTQAHDAPSVPDAFARSTIEREGDAGRRWIADLPDLVVRLLHRWDLTRDGPATHGYVGLVLPVRRGTEACVLKVSWMDDSNAHEHVALEVWNGDGAVRLLEADPRHGAILLERLEARSLDDEPIASALTIAARLLRRLAIPFEGDAPDLVDTATEIAASLTTLGRRFQDRVPGTLVPDALARLDALTPPRHRLLVDADLHYQNVLAATREPWLVIDPKIVIGDVEYGVAPLLWNRFDQIRARGIERTLEDIVDAAALDPERARAWIFVRVADYWLWALDVGLTLDPPRCAALIEALR